MHALALHEYVVDDISPVLVLCWGTALSSLPGCLSCAPRMSSTRDFANRKDESPSTTASKASSATGSAWAKSSVSSRCPTESLTEASAPSVSRRSCSCAPNTSACGLCGRGMFICAAAVDASLLRSCTSGEEKARTVPSGAYITPSARQHVNGNVAGGTVRKKLEMTRRLLGSPAASSPPLCSNACATTSP